MPANIVNVDYWNLFQIQPRDRVLDVGCGNGRHTIEATNWDCQVVALDIDGDELRRTRYMFFADHNAGRLPGFAEFARADAEHLPFSDGAFDKVIATEVLEHVMDDGRAMRELHRVLRPGGEIVVSSPHHRAERLLWAMSWDYWHSPGGHVRIYRKGELRERLTRVGFELGAEGGRHAYQSVYWTLRCLFGKDRPDFVVTRAFWRFIDWHLRSRNPVTEGIEAALDRVIPKDFVIYRAETRVTAESESSPAVLQSPERQRRVSAPARLGRPSDDPALERAFTVDLRLMGLSDASPGMRLLDLGCGAGRHELGAARLPIAVVACDLSRADLLDGRFFLGEDARERAHSAAIDWLQADGAGLPFADGSFDAVLCSETLEHVWDDRALLRELRRVAQPAATLAVSVPLYGPEWWLWALSWAVTHTPGGHLRIYRPRDLRMKLREAGWQPYAVRRRHAFETGYWLLGALAGGGDPPPRIARVWRRFVNPAHPGRARLVARIERWFDPVLAKSLVVYARAV